MAAEGKIDARLFREASNLTEEILEIGEWLFFSSFLFFIFFNAHRVRLSSREFVWHSCRHGFRKMADQPTISKNNEQFKSSMSF